ncbi:Rho GTPase activation protein [Gorgonomyces haynaldii]|nr:Rho GTPase activation protein [Gorgonomyces haynaldii]
MDSDGVWTTHRLSGKIFEAKHLQSEGMETAVCICRLDNNADTECRSVSSSIDNPFWAEPFSFDVSQGFGQIKFVICGQREEDTKPIGKLTFTPDDIYANFTEEAWFALRPAEMEQSLSSGKLLIQITRDTIEDTHVIAVRVLRGRQLFRDPASAPNTFVVLHLLPDPEALSTQTTRTVQANPNPEYGETFLFAFKPSEQRFLELFVSVWDAALTQYDVPLQIGHVKIPLKRIGQRETFAKWYDIDPPIAEPQTEKKVKSRRRTMASNDEDKGKPKHRELAKTAHLLGQSEMPQPPQEHQYSDKTTHFAACGVCKAAIVSNGVTCTVCSLSLHTKCQSQVKSVCKAPGTIKLKIEIQSLLVLDFSVYEPLLRELELNDYAVPALLGRISQDREQAAVLLIQILHRKGSSSKFIESMIQQEVVSAANTQTLFRANSMASKAVDIYMKLFAGDYLCNTLEGVLKVILLNKESCELDPTRLQKLLDDKKTDPKLLLESHAARLTDYCSLVMDVIFKSVEMLPSSLKSVFGCLKSAVLVKFPQESAAVYTGISGFLFLRFFVPAVLNPRLFGLNVGQLDDTSARTLTLISKTVQNLANLVQFGQKEPFMEPMNAFIVRRLPEMKRYLDHVSTVKSDVELGVQMIQNNPRLSVTSSSRSTSAKSAQLMAEMHALLLANRAKLESENAPAVQGLFGAVDSISSRLQDLSHLLERVHAVNGTAAEEFLPPLDVRQFNPKQAVQALSGKFCKRIGASELKSMHKQTESEQDQEPEAIKLVDEPEEEAPQTPNRRKTFSKRESMLGTVFKY